MELLRTEERITARLMVCTHEYCEVIWLDWQDSYHRPCHAGKFFPDGRPKAGPVSAPLATLPVVVDGSDVIVGGGTA